VLPGTGARAARKRRAPPPAPRPPPASRVGRPVQDTSAAARRQLTGDSTGARNGSVDTATARRLGLPTGPSRTFPTPDHVIDSLLKLPGYLITRYVAQPLVVHAHTHTILLHVQRLVGRQ